MLYLAGFLLDICVRPIRPACVDMTKPQNGGHTMSFLDRLLGREKEPEQPRQPSPQYPPQYGQGNPQQYQQQYGNQQPQQPRQSGQLTDEQALDRYRYMLRTAPPETIE